MFTKLLKVGASLGVLAVASVAHADMAPSSDGSLTFMGVTLYGTYDIGVTSQTHGAPLNNDFQPGLNYLVSKADGQKYSGVAPNGLSQSKIGIKGVESLGDMAPGWDVVFKAETGFSPINGVLANGKKSVVDNNGIPLAQQSSSADSSRAGQAFNGEAYVGVSNKVWGTLTVGRQNSLELDGINTYDPMGGSYAFSPIGFSGTAAGFGDTEDARLDGSFKYRGHYDFVRFAAQFQPNGVVGGEAKLLSVGGDGWSYLKGLSVDGFYNTKADEIKVGTIGTTSASIGNTTLAGTVADTRSYSLMAKYAVDPALLPVVLFAGWEDITYKNPKTPIAVGYSDEGGFTLGSVNNTAFPRHEDLTISWFGAKYNFDSKLSFTGAWYHYDQGAFNVAPVTCTGPSTAISSQCSGTLNAYSLMADYHLTKAFDVYAGMMYSEVKGGQSAGYLHTNTQDPTVGLRFNF